MGCTDHIHSKAVNPEGGNGPLLCVYMGFGRSLDYEDSLIKYIPKLSTKSKRNYLLEID
jgi:hypothetical protein